MKWFVGRRAFAQVLSVAVISCCANLGAAQSDGAERTFAQSKASVERALKELQSSLGGRLPVLEGFAAAADHPERYQRGYYQSKVQVSSTPAGGSTVRVTTQVTAWYADPNPAKSGYRVLPSNGRLESDLLDQLADQLARNSGGSSTTPAHQLFPSERVASSASSSALPSSASKPESGPAPSDPGQPTQTDAKNEPILSAPVPRLPENSGKLSSSLAESLAEQEKAGEQPGQNQLSGKDDSTLRTEADNLEEILRNQAHPQNLVAVKKSGTPVVASASLTAKTLFLASAHDEFEMLDFNRDWVHVRISGLSRGWIWRNSLEMPESVPDADLPTSASPVPTAGEIFHVTREETAQFPGDWAPLRGKSVKIVSVEKINENGKDAGPQLRLEFAKSVLDKDYAELQQKKQELAGIVLIFDSVDGGMIAATFPTLQQWKAGKLSDAALWHECFFDPPETFGSQGASSSGTAASPGHDGSSGGNL